MAARKVSSKTCTWFGMDHIARARTKACVPLVSSKCMNLTVKNFAVVLASTSTCHLSGKTMAKPTMGHVWTKQFVLEGLIVFFSRPMEGGEKLYAYLGCPRTPLVFAFSVDFVSVLSMHTWIFSFFPSISASTHTIVVATLWSARCCGGADLVRCLCFHGCLSFIFRLSFRLGWDWDGTKGGGGCDGSVDPSHVHLLWIPPPPHIRKKKRNDVGCWDTRTIETSSNTP